MDAQVVKALRDSVSQDPQRLRNAGEVLLALIDNEQPKIVEALCRIILSRDGGGGAAGDEFDGDDVRLVAAIFLKNSVRARWDLHDDPKGMQPACRQLLKSQIIPMIMKAPQNVKIQLYDILKQMTREDFPTEWPELLPYLVDQYYQPFLAHVTSGAMSTNLDEIANAVMVMHQALSKYEKAERSEDILRALKGILQIAEKPLFMTFCYCAKLYVQLAAQEETSVSGQENVPSSNGRGEYVCIISQMTTASLEIIKFLHGVDLPAFFEDNLAELTTHVFALLKAPPCTAAENHPSRYLLENSDGLGLSDAMRVSCCELIHEYVVKYSEEYSAHVAEACKCLIGVLQQCSSSSQQDKLVASAMSAIAAIANVLWGPEVNLTGAVPDFLGVVCRDIVLKNVPIREDDVEAMEDDPLQFARDTWEGNQRGARREGVLQLIKALLNRHEADVRTVLLSAINDLLLNSQEASIESGHKYLMKEAATFLIVAVSAKTSTAARGITEVYEQAPVISFLTNHIVPALNEDLNKCHTSESVLFRCAALRYVCSFRHVIPPEMRQEILPLIVAHITPNVVLIHTTAAATLERLLSLGLDGRPLFDFNDPKIITPLTAAIHPLMLHIKGDVNTMDNEYVMKCLWKLLAVLPVTVGLQAARLRELADTLKLVAAKPVNPVFCHYLFETVAVASRSVAKQISDLQEAQSVHVYMIQSMNQIISEEESHAFVPYCYQILAGLLDTIPLAPPQDSDRYILAYKDLYMPVVNAVLVKERWTASASNVPGILAVLSMVLGRWWIWGDALTSHIEEFVRLFVYCLGHKKIPAKSTFDFVCWMIAAFPVSALSTQVTALLLPILQLIERTARRSTPSSPIVTFALNALNGLLLKFDLSVNGRLGHFDVAYPAAIDVVAILEARKEGVVCDFLKSIFLAAGEAASQPKDKRMMLVGTLSFLSHPVVKRNKELRDQLWMLAGVLSGAVDRESLLGPQRNQRSSPQGLTDDREEFLAAMSAQDEQGGIDASAVYNRLASASKSAQSNPLLLLATDDLLKQAMTEVQAYLGTATT